MEVKTTKTEYRELLNVLEKAANLINEKQLEPENLI